MFFFFFFFLRRLLHLFLMFRHVILFYPFFFSLRYFEFPFRMNTFSVFRRCWNVLILCSIFIYCHKSHYSFYLWNSIKCFCFCFDILYVIDLQKNHHIFTPMFMFWNIYFHFILQKTRKELAKKIAQLNSAIDDVSGQLQSDEAPNGANVISDEVETAI